MCATERGQDELTNYNEPAGGVDPLAARAQQGALPVIGYLGTFAPTATFLAAFRKGLADSGYVEGRNVAIDYVTDGQYDRLRCGFRAPAGRANRSRFDPTGTRRESCHARYPDRVQHPDDPVKLGLIATLARPGGNATGMNFLLRDLGAKQLGLLQELVPKTVRVGLLINSRAPNFDGVMRDLQAAASAIAVELVTVGASDSREIDAAFVALAGKRVDALVVGTVSFFFGRRVQITTLATRHGLPSIYNARDYAEAGGLMTYGTTLTEAFRQAGVYAGRILKGEKPADLPVVQSSKFEFIINLATARALGLDVPPTLLALADEVIE